jgi:hypothetical protein
MCHGTRFCTVFFDKILYTLNAFFTNLSFHNQVHRHLYSLLLPQSAIIPSPPLGASFFLKSFHTFGGAIGMSICLISRCQSTSTTTLTMAAGAPTVPESPTPFAPSGWLRRSHFSGHERCLAILPFPGLWPKFSLASVLWRGFGKST